MPAMGARTFVTLCSGCNIQPPPTTRGNHPPPTKPRKRTKEPADPSAPKKGKKPKKDTDKGEKPKAASKPKKKSDGADDEESEMFSVSDGEDSAEIWDPLLAG